MKIWRLKYISWKYLKQSWHIVSEVLAIIIDWLQESQLNNINSYLPVFVIFKDLPISFH